MATNRPNSIGNNASHGCIRMYVADAEKLYQLVPNWTRVVIEGGPYGLLDVSLRPLQSGDCGSHVLAVQQRLKALGYYGGWPGRHLWPGNHGGCAQGAESAGAGRGRSSRLGLLSGYWINAV